MRQKKQRQPARKGTLATEGSRTTKSKPKPTQGTKRITLDCLVHMRGRRVPTCARVTVDIPTAPSVEVRGELPIVVGGGGVEVKPPEFVGTRPNGEVIKVRCSQWIQERHLSS